MTCKSPLWTRDFTLICAVHLLMTLAFYSTMPVLPLWLSEHMRLSGFAVGAVVACYTGSAILVRPFIGYCLDRFGRRAVYLPAYFVFALVFFMYPLAGTAGMVAVLRLAHGLTWGATMAAANTTAVDLIPPAQRGEGIGLFGLAMPLAIALGPSMGIYCARGLGYSAPFVIGGIITLVGFAALTALRIPRVPLNTKPFSLASMVEKSSLPVSSVMFLCSLSYGSLMNYTALYATTAVPAEAGLFFLIFASGTGLVRFFAGPAFDRSGPARIMAFSFVLLAVGYLSLAFCHTPAAFYASALVLGLGSGVSIPIVMAMINSIVPPQRRGTANATLFSGMDLGICCGILLTGHSHDAFGWEIAFALLVLCIVAAGAVFFIHALPHYKRNLSKPEPFTPTK